MDGVIGADILNQYDVVFDVNWERVTLHTDPVEMEGATLPMTDLAGVPIIDATVERTPVRLFFDTGAFVTYVRDERIARHRGQGMVDDFYPTLGRFAAPTYRVPVTLGRTVYDLQSGVMPEGLAQLIVAHGVDGILGNEMLRRRQVGYFPRRRTVVFGREATGPATGNGGVR
jgi:hypothetical protein